MKKTPRTTKTPAPVYFVCPATGDVVTLDFNTAKFSK